MIPRLRAKLTALRHRLGEFWWYAALMFAVQLIGSLINFYTGLWLIPRVVSQSDLGAILPLMQIAAFLAVPLGLILTPVGKFLNTFMANGEAGKVKSLLMDACRVSLIAAVIMVAYTVAVAPFVQLRLRVPGVSIVVLLCGLAFLNGLSPVLSSATQALKKFDNMLLGGVVLAPLRLVLIWVLAGAFGVAGYMGAQLGVALVGLLIAAYGLRSVFISHQARVPYREHWREMLAFSVPVIATTLFCALAATVEPFVIRHRLPEVESAAYYVLTRFSEISGFMGGALGMLLFPLVSERFERGECTKRLLWQANIANLVFGSLFVAFLLVAGHWVLGLRPQWAVYQAFSGQMWRLGLITVLNVPIGLFLAHEVACRRFGFLWYATAVRLGMAVLLYGLTGWEFFRPYLPQVWWEAVNNMNPCRLDFIVSLSVIAQLVLVLMIVIHVARERGRGSVPHP